MAKKLCTGNYAAGRALALAGEANRDARGCAAGAYPITPQTEVIEVLRAYPFTRGRVVPVESEHSAMAVCIGAALAGARSFTASSSNGLAYMTENVFSAGYYRLPIVLIAVNRTLGPPWNIWADQGDSLALRDAAWLQLYCEDHQDTVDTILMAFRIAEDHRVMLPAMVCYDGFIVSHTTEAVDLPEQGEVDRFLPPLDLPHRLRRERPATLGGLAWPYEVVAHRKEIHDAMERVPALLDETRAEFARAFGRTPAGAIEGEGLEDAETVLVASNTMATTARHVVRERRARGEKVGLLRIKLFRPFPRERVRAALGRARRVAVLDRNHSPGSGGIFWQETATSLGGRSDLLLQGYLVGLGGGDVTPAIVSEILDDVQSRERASEPVWKGIVA